MIKTFVCRSLIFFILILVFLPPVNGQQSVYHDNPDALYREAVDLFEKELYEAAREKFQHIMSVNNDRQSVAYVDAAYYDAVCAIELGQPDAAEKVKSFASNYRSSRWMSRITLLQARILFKENKYQEAINTFRKVSPASLTKAERNEYFYKTAYAQLRTNDPDRALVNFAKVKEEKGVYQNPSLYYYAHIQYLKANYDDALKHFKRIEKDKTYNKLIPVYVMQIQFYKGNYDEVIEMGDGVMATIDNKRKADIAGMLAEAWYKKNNYTKALEYYTIYEQTSRKQFSRDDHYQIAFTKFSTGRYKEAIVNFQQAIGKDDPLSQNAYYYLGRCYYETRQHNFARNAFLSAYKSKADKQISEDALFNYARLSIEAGADPYNEAVPALEKFLADNPSSPKRNEASSYIVQLYLNSKNFEAALQSLEKIKIRNSELQTIYQQLAFSRGIELFNRGDFKQAIVLFEKTASEKADATLRAKATFWLADSWYREKNFTKAQSSYRDFLSMREAAKLDIFPLASYNLGYTYFSQKQYQAALPSFKQFVNQPYAKQPKLLYDAWLRIGDIHFISKQYTEAANAYDQVVKARQTESDYALFQKAQCFGAIGNFNQKIATLDALVKSYPTSSYYDKALYEMGSTNLVMNDSRSAIANFDKLVRERPRSPHAKEALIKIGLMYFNNDQNDKAIASLKKVVSDYPGTVESREALNTLKSIYMEMNKLQEFFAYAEKSGIVQISGNEQDSLAFAMAENFYQEGRTNDAAIALKNYLSRYPNGAYLLQANYYSAKIALKEKKLDEALSGFTYIIEFPDNQFTDEALIESARILYDKEDYAKSHQYYSRLHKLAEDPLRQIEALEGKMKSSYFLKRYDDAISEARMLRNHEKTGDKQLVQSMYILGKSLFETRKFDDAEVELNGLMSRSKAELGAEASYLCAYISFENGKYEEAENRIFSLADSYGAYEYWVAKGFILLADVYVKNNNVFQAKQTLQSIIDNYQGEDLRNEATRKLSMLN
ncbi:MAG: tetratricopeptide repeat protein [Bacteroidales bacterium]|nr:tetratricopeptide repeat protein [Bacteroidales bacterium]